MKKTILKTNIKYVSVKYLPLSIAAENVLNKCLF